MGCGGRSGSAARLLPAIGYRLSRLAFPGDRRGMLRVWLDKLKHVLHPDAAHALACPLLEAVRREPPFGSHFGQPEQEPFPLS